MFAGLSACMKRRTLCARALATNPDLLLLDEPTYFDQLRAQLDEQKTVLENMVEGNDLIIF